MGAGPCFFNGLPGLRSHQTRSSPNRFNASRVICACPSCAGSNDPPNRPTTCPLVANGMVLRKKMAPDPKSGAKGGALQPFVNAKPLLVLHDLARTQPRDIAVQ